jgi:acyl-CoA hydrolase
VHVLKGMLTPQDLHSSPQLSKLEPDDRIQHRTESELRPTMMESGDPALPPRKPAESRSEMTELILPNDANTLGNLLGGRLMHYIDLVGAMAAYRHARSYVVTASMDHIDFIAPVHVADLLILKSSLNRAFRTSMEVGVKVWVEHPIEGTMRHVASAYLTFVAVDRSGKRVCVSPLEPETQDEQRRYKDAGRRREQAEKERERKKSALQSNAAGTGPQAS